MHPKYRKMLTGILEPPNNIYTELEWIESDGSQVLNTNILVDSKSHLYCSASTVYIENVENNAYALYGTRVGNTNQRWIFDDNIRYGITNAGTETYIYGTDGPTFDTYQLRENKYYKNDRLLVTCPEETFTNPFPVYVFAVNNSGSIYYRGAYRVNKFYIKVDGVHLTIDLIPVKMYDGRVGMWDRVTNTFFGSMTDTDFIAGPEKTTVDYIEYSYVQSTGSQYINTRYNTDIYTGTTKMRIENLDEKVNIGSYGYLNRSDHSYRWAIGISQGKWFLGLGGHVFHSGISAPIGTIADVTWDRTLRTFSVNDDRTNYTISGTYNGNDEFYIIARNGLEGIPDFDEHICRLYSLQEYDSEGVLILDLVPALCGLIACMWDKVTDTPFYNLSPIPLVLGPPLDTTNLDLAYFKTNGTQLVKSDFLVGNDNATATKIKFIIQYPEENENYCLTGISGVNQNTTFGFGRSPEGRLVYGNFDDLIETTFILEPLHVYMIELDYVNKTLSVNGNKITNITLPVVYGDSNRVFCLMGYNTSDNTTFVYNWVQTIYECKIYMNNDIVHDYIAHNTNGRVDIIDKQTNMLVGYTSDNNSLLLGGPPYTPYIPLQYLYFDGTQLIDLGVKGTESQYVNMTARSHAYPSDATFLYGARDSYLSKTHAIATNVGSRLFYGGCSNGFSNVVYWQHSVTTMSLRDWYNLEVYTGHLTMRDIAFNNPGYTWTYPDMGPFTTRDNMMVGGMLSDRRRGYLDLQSFQFVDNDVELFNLTPVMSRETGVCGFLNSVTGILHTPIDGASFTTAPGLY